MVKFNIFLILLFLLPVTQTNAQADKKFIRKGNKEYEKHDYTGSEILYRKASDKNKQSSDALFNTGDALYRQKKYEDADKQFMENADKGETNIKKAAGLYNLGNSLLSSNKVSESIEAFENSLKLNPDNMQAKYNLAYAQDLLKKQQQQKQQQQQQNQNNKDQKQDQNKNNQQNQNKQDQNQNQNSKQDQQKQQQQQQQGISKEDAERLLNAIANEEKDVQKKVEQDKAARVRVGSVKNW